TDNWTADHEVGRPGGQRFRGAHGPTLVALRVTRSADTRRDDDKGLAASAADDWNLLSRGDDSIEFGGLSERRQTPHLVLYPGRNTNFNQGIVDQAGQHRHANDKWRGAAEACGFF